MKILEYYKVASNRFYTDVKLWDTEQYNGHDYFPDYLNSLDNFELLEFLMESSGESLDES